MTTKTLRNRLEPLNEKLRRMDYLMENEFLLPRADSYVGIVDGFFPDAPGRGNSIHYVLWLDTLSKKYKPWKKHLKVKGNDFSFAPKPSFSVSGKVVDKGDINGFEYYFIEIKDIVHPNIPYAIT